MHVTVIYEGERWTVCASTPTRLCIRRFGVMRWVDMEATR